MSVLRTKKRENDSETINEKTRQTPFYNWRLRKKKPYGLKYARISSFLTTCCHSELYVPIDNYSTIIFFQRSCRSGLTAP